MIERILSFLRCRHRKRSMPFTDPKLGTYQVCLSCGKKIRFEWEKTVQDHPYLQEVVHAR